MKWIGNRCRLRPACLGVAAAMAAMAATGDARPVRLGPANPGGESGLAKWYAGATGGGAACIDRSDPATGCADFRIVNGPPATRWKNHAALRSDPFALGHPARTHGPVTLSFAYKLPGRVKPGDNVALYLQFLEQSETLISYVGGKKILVGSATADSEMTRYKTITVTNIVVPGNAVAGEVWIMANTRDSWTSGVAQFDDISVTAAPEQSPAGGLAALTALLLGALWARHSPRAAVTGTNRGFSSPPARA